MNNSFWFSGLLIVGFNAGCLQGSTVASLVNFFTTVSSCNSTGN